MRSPCPGCSLRGIRPLTRHRPALIGQLRACARKGNGSGLRRFRKHVQIVFQDPYAALNPLHTVGYTLSRPVVNYLGLYGSAASARVSGWSGTSAVEKGFGTLRLYHGCARGAAVNNVATASPNCGAPCVPSWRLSINSREPCCEIGALVNPRWARDD